jgi:hypothetical protein
MTEPTDEAFRWHGLIPKRPGARGFFRGGSEMVSVLVATIQRENVLGGLHCALTPVA